MGYKVYQRILECAICHRTPDDGEPLWEMCLDYWCESCCDKTEGQEEEPSTTCVVYKS